MNASGPSKNSHVFSMMGHIKVLGDVLLCGITQCCFPLVTEELPVDASLGSSGDSNSSNELEKADMRIVESAAKDVCTL